MELASPHCLPKWGTTALSSERLGTWRVAQEDKVDYLRIPADQQGSWLGKDRVIPSPQPIPATRTLPGVTALLSDITHWAQEG